jgi:hypothetical protein
MPTIQSTYLDDMAVGYAGAIADNQEECNLISRIVEDSGGIAFGLAVAQGTDDDGIVVGDGTAFLGVTVRDQSVDPEDPNLFAHYASARIMTKGVIWVANDGGVSAGDPVSLGADGALGTGGSNEVAGARWDTTATDGNLAILRLG